MADASLRGHIEAELSRRRSAARASLEERRARAFELCPTLPALEAAMSDAGLCALDSMSNGETEPSAAESALSSLARDLSKKRQALLSSAGLPPDYLDLSPFCARCGDTGLLRGRKADGSVDYGAPPTRCACARQLMTDALYQDSGLASVGAARFDMFDKSLYSDAKCAAAQGESARTLSPRENIGRVHDSARMYLRSLLEGGGENLYFYGVAGTGKTFVAAAIANEAVRGGIAVLYQTAPTMFNVITEYRTRFLSDDGYRDARYRRILDADLLVIDDLGTEPKTDARYAEFITLLNARLEPGRKSTIIASNFDPESLWNRYDERVASRISGYFKIVRFYGADIRLFGVNNAARADRKQPMIDSRANASEPGGADRRIDSRRSDAERRAADRRGANE